MGADSENVMWTGPTALKLKANSSSSTTSRWATPGSTRRRSTTPTVPLARRALGGDRGHGRRLQPSWWEDDRESLPRRRSRHRLALRGLRLPGNQLALRRGCGRACGVGHGAGRDRDAYGHACGGGVLRAPLVRVPSEGIIHITHAGITFGHSQRDHPWRRQPQQAVQGDQPQPVPQLHHPDLQPVGGQEVFSHDDFGSMSGMVARPRPLRRGVLLCCTWRQRPSHWRADGEWGDDLRPAWGH